MSAPLAAAPLILIAIAFLSSAGFAVSQSWARERPRAGSASRAGDTDTLVISRGRMDRSATEDAESETLITTRRRRGDVDIDLGRRGHIRIDDSGEGDRVLMGDDITVEKDEVVEGDAVAIGGNVTVLGKVMGDAVAIGGNMILGDSAYVAGDAVSVGGGLDKSKSAHVGGESVQVGIKFPFMPWTKHHGARASAGNRIGDFVRWLVFYLVVFAFAALVIYLARDRIGHASRSLGRDPLPSFLWGLSSPFLVLVGFILLCITLIGIPVALALIFLYPLFLFLGWVVAGHRVGCAVGQGEEPTMRTMMIGNQVIPGGSTNGGTVTVRTVFVGLLVISGLHILYVLLRLFGVSGFPVTFIMLAGFFVSFTASLVGLGALIRTRFRLPPAAQPAMAYAPAGGDPLPPAAPGGVTTPPAQPGSPPVAG